MIPWRNGEWSRGKLGGEPVPGLMWVTVTPSRDVTLSPSPGKDAPVLKDGGGRGATVRIEIEVWTTYGDHSQLTALARVLRVLDPQKPGGTKQPVSIVHPATALAGVAHICSATYTIPRPTGGRLIVPIDAVQWFPEEDTTKPANAAGASSSPATAPGGDGGPFGSGEVPEPDPANLGADYP